MEQFIGKGEMPGQIPCGSAIKLNMSIMAISISLSRFSILCVVYIQRQQRFSGLLANNTLLEESHHYCADKFRRMVM